MANWFKRFLKKVSKAFVIVFGSKVAKRFAKASKSLLKTALGSIALSVVAELELSNLSTAEKRQQAFNRIVARAKSEGIVYKASLINIAIEFAVQRLKGAAESE